MRVEPARLHVDLHVCVLNRHAVWYGYNAEQCVESTRILSKLHAECQYYTHDVKITLVRVV
jgi:hypothetical protein